MNLSDRDQRLLHRFLDGELTAAEADAFRARSAAEPALRASVEAEQAVRAGFVAARGGVQRAPSGFTANVLAAARRLPTAQELEAVAVASTRSFCRRLLLAAAVLFGLGLLWHAGLLRGSGAATMHAAPDDVREEIDRLDARLQSGVVPPPSARAVDAPERGRR